MEIAVVSQNTPSLTREVRVVVDIFRCLREAELHPFVATLALRKHRTGDDHHLMLLCMMLAIDFVVEDLINAGSLDSLSGLKLFVFFAHILILLCVEGAYARRQKATVQ